LLINVIFAIKVSSGLVAQLMLDWMETRHDALFDSKIIDLLNEQFNKFSLLSNTIVNQEGIGADGFVAYLLPSLLLVFIYLSNKFQILPNIVWTLK